MKNIKMIRLIAENGKILFNGKDKVYAVDIPEEEKDNWAEIDEQELNNAIE